MNLITITAIDRGSSDSRSRTLSSESPEVLAKGIQEFENELEYRRYELITEDFAEDYEDSILQVLDEMQVTY